MELERDDLVQYGVLWATAGSNELGEQRILAPIEFRCRWELGSILVDSPISNAYRTVGRATVDRQIGLESIVWKGKLTDLHIPYVGLMQVVDYREVPDVKGMHVRRTVILASWNGSLPPAVV